MKFIFLAAVLACIGSPVFAHQSVLSGVAHEIDHVSGVFSVVLSLAVGFSVLCGAAVLRKNRLAASASH